MSSEETPVGVGSPWANDSHGSTMDGNWLVAMISDDTSRESLFYYIPQTLHGTATYAAPLTPLALPQLIGAAGVSGFYDFRGPGGWLIPQESGWPATCGWLVGCGYFTGLLKFTKYLKCRSLAECHISIIHHPRTYKLKHINIIYIYEYSVFTVFTSNFTCIWNFCELTLYAL